MFPYVLGGGNSNICLYVQFIPICGERIQFDYIIFFQMGWNHQLDKEDLLIYLVPQWMNECFFQWMTSFFQVFSFESPLQNWNHQGCLSTCCNLATATGWVKSEKLDSPRGFRGKIQVRNSLQMSRCYPDMLVNKAYVLLMEYGHVRVNRSMKQSSG